MLNYFIASVFSVKGNAEMPKFKQEVKEYEHINNVDIKEEKELKQLKSLNSSNSNVLQQHMLLKLRKPILKYTFIKNDVH